MRKIVLHGALGAKHEPFYELEVETAAEAVRALCLIVPNFMLDLREGAYRIVMGEDPDEGFALDEDQIAGFRLGRSDLHLVPVVAGSKSGGGTLKIVLGVALIGVAFAFSAGALAAPILGGALGGLTYGNVAMVGLALAATGVSSMLSPEEKTSEKKDTSFTLSGPGNAYNQGYPVPLVYGEVITGGVLVSGGVDIESIPVGT